jgi:entry exclusion lipoprotein TrbK
MFRLIVACFVLAAFSLAGCGKEEPKEVKSIRKIENLKKLPKNK